MERKKLFTIFSAAGAFLLLAGLMVFPLIKNLSASNNNSDQITEITLCDVDARDLCIVTFGADNANHMIINFQLPSAGYPAFYVNGANKGTDNPYPCVVVKAVPTSVYCIGARTPLGEAIDLEVYAADSDQLIARGTITISALVLATSIDYAAIPAGKIVTPTPTLASTPTATLQVSSTLTPTVTFTPTPGAGYPNP